MRTHVETGADSEARQATPAGQGTPATAGETGTPAVATAGVPVSFFNL
jgi:hypothetical protein